MKKRVLITSILTIVMCISLITGATFALFTSQSEVNIAVTSGTVNVVANVDQNSVQTKQLYDTEYSQGKNNMYGGVATFTEKSLTLETMLPGDGIKFDIVVSNESDVKVKYRTIISCVNDNGLFTALNINIGAYSNYNSVRAVSNWEELEVGVADAIVPVEIELPEDANDEFQNKTCTLTYVVEAVQSNADTVNVNGNGKTTAVKVIEDAKGNSALIPVDTSIKNGNLGVSLEIKDLEEEPANVQTGLFEVATDGEAYAYNVNIPEIGEDNETAIVITMDVQAGLEGVVLLFHKGVPMNAVLSASEVDEDGEFFYDAINGVVTFATKNFSNFTLASGFENLAVVNGDTSYADIIQYFAEGKDIYVTENINITEPSNNYRTDITVDSDVALYVANNAVLTMDKVTIILGTGSITMYNGNISIAKELCISGDATFIIEGGEHDFGALSMTGNGKLVVNDGILNCWATYAGIMSICFGENGSLIVNGGKLNMYQPFNLNPNRCDRAYVEINGGVIELLDGNENLFVCRNIMDKDREEGGTLRGAIIRINGGTFIAHYEVDRAGDATAFIRNGDPTADTNRALVSDDADGFDCVVSGGTFYGSWQRADNQRYTDGNGGYSDGKFMENSIAGFVADDCEIVGDPDNGYIVKKS